MFYGNAIPTYFRKRTLTTEILNKVFKCKKISPVQGHGGCLGTQYPGNHGFEYVPEADLVVDADQEVDLLNEGLSPTEFTLEMDMKVSCNWLAIQGMPKYVICAYLFLK